eukprot:CAMPEP_0174272842 /NCGR_PEP_ID=MMETSP0439-20130205/52542_1 /TAXON_ID=0 /ORGANISM="Stereomyxa ramosa, Strain Chinc5" /LENGTH=1663 /DNA_ID=CAMNT_0015363635 /DNA_START=248 /DNA_END=5239 /DNA_ORIENTATION=-
MDILKDNKNFLIGLETEKIVAGTEECSKLDFLANELTIPLSLACESRQPALMGIALDCFQKLMLYGYIRGDAVVAGTDKLLMDEVVEVITGCFRRRENEKEFPNATVQLQILKALLSAVVSSSCGLHGDVLMIAIKTCYSIYLISTNSIIIDTAKASLDQMLDVIFARMGSKEKVVTKPKEESEIEEESEDGRDESADSESKDKEKDTETESEDEYPEQQNGQEKPPKIVYDIVKEANRKSVLVSSTNGDKGAGKMAFNDCAITFRALCKLSNKDLHKDTAFDSMEMRSKILSLELLLVVLGKIAPIVFANKDDFVRDVIRKYLCPSIATNGTSSNPRVFQLTLSIFLSLITHFKEQLKEEIGIYFKEYFLKILESDNSTTQQKGMVLQALLEVCNHPQTLVDIFINYDCRLHSSDIFGRMVDDLSGIAKGTTSVDSWNSPEQGVALQTLGLECLVTIMQSMVNWSKELHMNGMVEDDLVDSSENENSESEENISEVAVEEEEFEFERTKHIKQKLALGKRKFNVNPVVGLNYLVHAGFVEGNPKSIANFLLENSEGLDKVQIGNYFGQGGKKGEYSKKVLYEFIDGLNFSGMPIDVAIRHIFKRFMPGGEEKQIDIVMVKFAERYMLDNPDSILPETDVAYKFAYSIMLLFTDLHNPNIPKKMSFEQWKRNNKSIMEEQLPDKYQREVYDRIAKSPLTSYENFEQTSIHEPLNPSQKELRWIFESKSMAKRVQGLLEKKLEQESTYYTAKEVIAVKPMFEVCWCPMLAAFSVLLETTDDPKIIDLCLMGFKCAVRVSSIFYMQTTRNTFVTSLAKFTHLTNFRIISHKNIASIKTLITVAHTEGNYLQNSWKDVLYCISKLEYIHLLGSGATSENTFLENTEKIVGVRSKSFPRISIDILASPILPLTRERSVAGNQVNFEGINAETVAKEIEGIAIERIYTDSTLLSNGAIVDFVTCLCEVSWNEINEDKGPRIFSLQKLVETAYYNMGRIRIVWSKIWDILGDHFARVGSHKNLSVSMYAIDSLRQLAMKFLEKEELSSYHFQKDFLKPFEVVVAEHTSKQIRDMIIRCLTHMIQAAAGNIKSGWKSIFSVLSIAARDDQIIRLGFEAVEGIMRDHFELFCDTFFVECVNCLVTFAENTNSKDISLKALSLLVFCCKELSAGSVVRLSEGEMFSATDSHIKYWFPVLTGFSSVVSHPHIDVRTISLERLFHVLKEYGPVFEPDLWELIFRGVILPIFKGATAIATEPKSSGNIVDKVWVGTTCLNATQSMVSLISHFFDNLSFLMDEVLALLTSFILQGKNYTQATENLAEIGTTCLVLLIMDDGRKFSSFMWDIACMCLHYIIDYNLPVEVFSYEPPKKMRDRIRKKRSSQPEERKIQDDKQEQQSQTTTPPSKEEESENEKSEGKGKEKETDQNSSQLANSQEAFEFLSPMEKAKKKLERVTPERETQFTSFSDVKARCSIHILLIAAVYEIFFEHYPLLSTDNIKSLYHSIHTTHQFSHKACCDQVLRDALSPTGVMIKIIKIEISSMGCILKMLFTMYADDSDQQRQEWAESRLLETIVQFLGEFLQTAINSSSSYSRQKVELVVQILRGLAGFTSEQFLRHIAEYYDILVGLMASDSKAIRAELQVLFTKIGQLHDISKVVDEEGDTKLLDNPSS